MGDGQHKEAGYTLDQVVEHLDDRTERLTKTTKTLAFGVLALGWGVIFLKDELAFAVGDTAKLFVAAAMVVAVVTLIFDYVQAWAAFRVTDDLVDAMEAENLAEGFYEEKEFAFHLSSWMFQAKLISTIVSTTSLVIGIGIGFVRSICG